MKNSISFLTVVFLVSTQNISLCQNRDKTHIGFKLGFNSFENSLSEKTYLFNNNNSVGGESAFNFSNNFIGTQQLFSPELELMINRKIFKDISLSVGINYAMMNYRIFVSQPHDQYTTNRTLNFYSLKSNFNIPVLKWENQAAGASAGFRLNTLRPNFGEGLFFNDRFDDINQEHRYFYEFEYKLNPVGLFLSYDAGIYYQTLINHSILQFNINYTISQRAFSLEYNFVEIDKDANYQKEISAKSDPFHFGFINVGIIWFFNPFNKKAKE